MVEPKEDSLTKGLKSHTSINEAKQEARMEKAIANLRETLKKVHPDWQESQIETWIKGRF